MRPGHFLLWEGGETNVQQYWDVQYNIADKQLADEEYVDELHRLLRDSVNRRMISDVPLGAFLSGGIDSSIIVALMTEVSDNPVKTFSIGFEEKEYSELSDARLVADKFDTDHHEKIVNPDSIELLPDLVWHFCEPFGDSSAVPTYYVSKIAREKITVALSGDGGDELFAGYLRYADRNQYTSFKQIPRTIRERIIGPIANMLPIGSKGKFMLKEIGQLNQRERDEIVDIYPPIKENLFSAEFSQSLQDVAPAWSSFNYWQNKPNNSRLSAMQYLDTKVYLPEDIMTKVDRMAMANSLETRAPLLDYKVVEFAATIPPHMHMKDGKGKYILRKLASRFLPQQIISKKKQGFAIPRDQWFRGELNNYALEMFRSDRFRSRGYFNHKTIDLILNEHVKGKRDYSTWFWCLIVFELWHQLFIDSDTRRI